MEQHHIWRAPHGWEDVALLVIIGACLAMAVIIVLVFAMM